MDGYTYDEWLAVERLRALMEYRGRRLLLDKATAKERRRLAAAREANHGGLGPSLGHEESVLCTVQRGAVTLSVNFVVFISRVPEQAFAVVVAEH